MVERSPSKRKACGSTPTLPLQAKGESNGEDNENIFSIKLEE